jgi:photosystem II stability/assembly factor-like uncharacterized protein
MQAPPRGVFSKPSMAGKTGSLFLTISHTSALVRLLLILMIPISFMSAPATIISLVIPFIGDGIYKSTDGGNTWTNIGLKDTRIISRIEIDPGNSNIIYAATMGIPFQRNNDRGLYKSIDGGQTWSQILFVADQAGIIDLVIHPNDPQILYASSWDRIRNNSESIVADVNAKIWKTTDGGTTWTVLGGGLPTGVQGRIGLDMFRANPDTLFAIYVSANSNLEGVYRTYNGGITWTNVSGNLPTGFLGGFGWYFGQIRVDPANPNQLWALGVSLYRTLDGGNTWSDVSGNTHVDKHDLKYGQNGVVFKATDGGLYSTSNNGSSWIDVENIPNNQFYRVAVNPFQPNDFYGGLQDNGSVGGNASGFNSWTRYFGGDGFQMRFSSTNPQHWYCQTQNGGLWYSTNGGNSFNWHGNGIDGSDRRSWDMPLILNHINPNTQYCGTYRVYRNTGGVNANWQAISPDITDGINSRYNVISSVNESPLDTNILYAGTTDGNVWITTNYGANWVDITDTLPNRYVTSVKGSPSNSARLFVSHSGYKDNDFMPHLHRSDDFGATWQNIAGDLPPLAINDVFIYPNNDSVIFVANDGGVYATLNAGASWQRIGNNMPIVAVYDLEIEPTNNLLVAGTYGRSLWTFPIDSVLASAVPTPEIMVDGNNEICEGDSVMLSVGNNAYDSLLWSTGATTASIFVKSSGTYSVVGFIDGCPSDSSISQTVIVNPLPPAPVISGPNTICDGASILLSGPAGFGGYFWSNNALVKDIVVSMPGTYTLIVIDTNNCMSPPSASFVVDAGNAPTALFNSMINGTQVDFSDSSLDVGSSGTYHWDFGDGSQVDSSANPSHIFPGSGIYTVTLIVSNACGKDTLTQDISVIASSLEAAWASSVSVYPNPASSSLHIEIEQLPGTDLSYQLIDTQGRVILSKTRSNLIGTFAAEVSVAHLADGIYLLNISDGKQVYTQRILKKR